MYTQYAVYGQNFCVKKDKKNLFSSGFEPETFRVLGGCDNQLHHENA